MRLIQVIGVIFSEVREGVENALQAGILFFASDHLRECIISRWLVMGTKCVVVKNEILPEPRIRLDIQGIQPIS